ncbi:MAG: AAA family ATPase [Methanobacteriaceae archaeon]|nr:AAA family ATPase [Methanobacteriaceae archaeon]
MDIRNVDGIGDKLACKIIDSYGGLDNFISRIKNYDIEQLMEIDGLSQRKAMNIVNYVLNNPSNNFLKTEESKIIYEDIINRILKFTNTTYAKNRVLLINPSNNMDSIKNMQNIVSNAMNICEDLDLNYIQDLYENVDYLVDDFRPVFNDSICIVCEEYDDYIKLLDNGFNKFCNILTGEDVLSFDNYEFIIFLYGDCLIDIGDASNVVMVSNNSQDYEILPDSLISYFITNKSILENTFKIRKALNWDSDIGDVLNLLDGINDNVVDLDDIIDIVEDLKDQGNKKIKSRIRDVNLSGEDVLLLLDEDNVPPKIQNIFDFVIDELLSELSKKTNLSFDPFIVKYPLKIDYDEIERVKKIEYANKHINSFERKVEACKTLSDLKDNVVKEVLEVIHFDYDFTLGCFSKYYGLTIPEFGMDYIIHDGLHIRLKSGMNESNKEMQLIDYNLNSDDGIVLLTGANSGGKTTLLEMLAQFSIMGHMGLGVCASKCILKLEEEIYYFSKKHSLDAGAFETFLKKFIPITLGKDDKLILLDEIESITELEAAIKIISGFIENIQNTNSFAIIVTHMAPQILKQVKVRVDGIEAKGLDKDYNLIVDRSPHINYLANSTPELILQKMYEKAENPLKEVYGDILKKFQ